MRNNSTLSASVSNEKRQTAKVIIYISGTAEVQHWISNNTILFKRGDLSSIYKLVQFSSSVVSDSLQPHGLQHARLPCPSPTPRACLKLMSIESVMPSNHFILCCPLLLPSIFPSIRVFPMSQFFASSGQSIGVSTSASVLPMNIQD